jgi:RHS repeat-associated protein
MELLRYFYHPYHTSTRLSKGLVSSASTELSNLWITDNTGRPIQHLHYLPFGEDWVDQRNSSWNAPYTFSGKEKDVETGYGYFGARYYDSGLSIWLSVDPMSDKYPSMSPYNYCANNPVILVDPDGRIIVPAQSYIGTTYEKVHNYLKNNNTAYSTALKPYIESSVFNLRLDCNGSKIKPGKGAFTDYRYTFNESGSINIFPGIIKTTTTANSTESYLPSKKNTNMSLWHFYITIHEKGHSLEALNPKTAERNANHNGYTESISILNNIWTELSNDLSLDLTPTQINEISLYGAEESDMFKSYIRGLANQNGTTIEQETSNFKIE